MSTFDIPPRLEDLCVSAYLTFLEAEASAYVTLTQSDSSLLKSIAPKMVAMLKKHLSLHIGAQGVSSTAIRQKMLEIVLSDRFPSPKYCNVYFHKRTAKEVLAEAPELYQNYHQPNVIAQNEVVEETEHLYSSCLNSCCTGAFIKETMAGIIMSHEIKELIFTNDNVNARKSAFLNAHEFDSPVVLTHLLSATHEQFSQLEKLIFSEHFVKEEPSASGLVSGDEEVITRLRLLQHQHPARILEAQRQRQCRFVKKFAQGNNTLYTSSDRRGLVLNLLVMFRDIAPKSFGSYKLTVLVLKNNIQCELYSKANFQFELLARIGFCCPKLKILDIFGTDTWADCLVALFFRDAFHSLHRYLFFMEDENDENSAYHPHDLSKYCQFCLDRLHPVTVERPFTVNPIIPLIDPIYDHVIKKYPKRSYCILRNCIRVSDLIGSTTSNVFELMRPPPPISSVKEEEAATDDNNICSRLRSRKRKNRSQPRQVVKKKMKSSIAKQPPHSSSDDDEAEKSSGKKGSNDDIDALHGIMYRNEINPRSGGEDKEPNDNEEEKSVAVDSPAKNTRKSCRLSANNNKTPMVQRKRRSENWNSKSSLTMKTGQLKQPDMESVSFDAWQKETSLALANRKHVSGLRPLVTGKCPDSEGKMCMGCNAFYANDSKDSLQSSKVIDYSCVATNPVEGSGLPWIPPSSVKYREITQWPHLNDCIQSLEVLNIGGTNVLGEFIPFILLHAKNLKSLGQWINTMIYGLEILRDLPGGSGASFPNIQEFSYSSDRNYFCQPYIGFVPETKEYRNVRKEMVKQSARVAKRISHSIRYHSQKQKQIAEDVALMTSMCPNVKKLNLVLHYKMNILSPDSPFPWQNLKNWKSLTELDLVSMKFSNVQSLLSVIGGQLEALTLETDEEQGNGSELVFIARNCLNLRNLRILIGDKTLMGESNLCYDLPYLRKVETLTIEGSVHLHAFVFLWGHCRALRFLKMGSVVSNNGTNTNVLVYEVFTLLLQVNKMAFLEELHIKNLKIKSLHMGFLLLDNLPKLKKASNFLLDIYGQDLILFKKKLLFLKQKRNFVLDYKEW